MKLKLITILLLLTSAISAQTISYGCSCEADKLTTKDKKLFVRL